MRRYTELRGRGEIEAVCLGLTKREYHTWLRSHQVIKMYDLEFYKFLSVTDHN